MSAGFIATQFGRDGVITWKTPFAQYDQAKPYKNTAPFSTLLPVFMQTKVSLLTLVSNKLAEATLETPAETYYLFRDKSLATHLEANVQQTQRLLLLDNMKDAGLPSASTLQSVLAARKTLPTRRIIICARGCRLQLNFYAETGDVDLRYYVEILLRQLPPVSHVATKTLTAMAQYATGCEGAICPTHLAAQTTEAVTVAVYGFPMLEHVLSVMGVRIDSHRERGAYAVAYETRDLLFTLRDIATKLQPVITRTIIKDK